MNIAFRVNASKKIGYGHLSRCLSIARAVSLEGISTKFLCPKEQIQSIREWINRELQNSFITICPLEIDLIEVGGSKDVLESIKYTTSETILLLDSYDIGIEFEKAIKSHVKKIIVIDDLANRPHVCDVIIDQTPVDDEIDRYQSLIPSTTQKLFGLQYCIIPTYKFNKIKKSINNFSKEINILIYFGETDMVTIESKLHRIIRSHQFLKSSKIWIRKGIIKKNELSKSDVEIFNSNKFNIAMSSVDIAIGTAGQNGWERCYLGIPSVVIPIGRGHKEVINKLVDVGCWIKHSESDIENAAEKLKQIIIDNNTYIKMSNAGRQLIDGNGVNRILQKILD